ncbi:MAG: signal peptidase II [Clostridium sp.]|nr:signal peptidase II [Clostridium sp.]
MKYKYSSSKRKKIKALAADLLFMAMLVIIDQFTKQLAVLHLKDKQAFKLIDGVLELNYLENKGAAFGMLQNQGVFFVFVAVIVLSVIGYILYKTPNGRKYHIMHILLSLIAAGAIGNMIDRVRLNYVVDFIYIVLINFPIFNVADMYVSFATAILVLSLLFYYKESDLSFIGFNQKKIRELK